MSDIDWMDYDQWRGAVKNAVLHRASTMYDVSHHSDYQLYPAATYAFQYRGQSYTNHPLTTNIAQAAMELRHNRLCGVPQPWEDHPCPHCHQSRSLNGRHLLQCSQLPTTLLEERAQLIREYYPDLTLANFAAATIACVGCDDTREVGLNPLIDFWYKSVVLGRKIMRYTRKAVSNDPPQDLAVESHTASDPPREPDSATPPQRPLCILPLCSLHSLEGA